MVLDQAGLLQSPTPSFFFFQRESEPEQSQVNPESNHGISTGSPFIVKASKVQLCAFVFPGPLGANPFTVGGKPWGRLGRGLGLPGASA